MNFQAFNQTYNPSTYTWTITTHGSPYCLMTAGSLANPSSVQVQSGYAASQQWAKQVPPGTKLIVLRACHGADGGANSNAQQFSNATGLPVQGYKGTAYPGTPPTNSFTPQSPAMASISGAANRFRASC